MNWKLTRPILALAALAALLAIGLPSLDAQESSTTESLEAQVEALRAMDPPTRRAELAKMTREQRQELWFELKRSEQTEKGNGPAVAGASPVYRKSVEAAPGQARDRAVAPPEKVVGAIVYDQNNPAVSFGGGAIIGNRFDTALGDPVLVSGTVSTVVAVVLQGPAYDTTGTSPSSSAGFVLEGPQTGGGGAFALFSTFTAGLTQTTETVTFSGIGETYPGSSFFVLFGDFASAYVPVYSSNSVNGQGHHGVVGYTGGMGPDITSTFDFGETLNALIRVTGNVLPVELMSFEVD